MVERRFNILDPLGLLERITPAAPSREDSFFASSTIITGAPVLTGFRTDLERINRRLTELRGEVAAAAQTVAGSPAREGWEPLVSPLSF
ncbi:hypothetical protein LCGC14_1368890 [marine sediment metagenome]|uniref:Uncharacterized protein n=1 Tax=marine sediment metagenome TaxID=412755 RepID=A0A0F9K6B8_9ZZZZ